MGACCSGQRQQVSTGADGLKLLNFRQTPAAPRTGPPAPAGNSTALWIGASPSPARGLPTSPQDPADQARRAEEDAAARQIFAKVQLETQAKRAQMDVQAAQAAARWKAEETAMWNRQAVWKSPRGPASRPELRGSALPPPEATASKAEWKAAQAAALVNAEERSQQAARSPAALAAEVKTPDGLGRMEEEVQLASAAAEQASRQAAVLAEVKEKARQVGSGWARLSRLCQAALSAEAEKSERQAAADQWSREERDARKAASEAAGRSRQAASIAQLELKKRLAAEAAISRAEEAVRAAKLAEWAPEEEPEAAQPERVFSSVRLPSPFAEDAAAAEPGVEEPAGTAGAVCAVAEEGGAARAKEVADPAPSGQEKADQAEKHDVLFRASAATDAALPEPESEHSEQPGARSDMPAAEPEELPNGRLKDDGCNQTAAEQSVPESTLPADAGPGNKKKKRRGSRSKKKKKHEDAAGPAAGPEAALEVDEAVLLERAIDKQVAAYSAARSETDISPRSLEHGEAAKPDAANHELDEPAALPSPGRASSGMVVTPKPSPGQSESRSVEQQMLDVIGSGFDELAF